MKLLAVILILLSGLRYSAAQDNDSLVIRYNYINTIPQNANIYLNGNLIGQSPLYFVIDSAVVNREFLISLDGYADYEYTPDETDELINKTFTLISLKGYVKKDIVLKDKSFAFEKPFKIVPVIISSAVTVSSAIVAYYFKSLAIQKGDDFELTGDPALLDKKKKYDVISGISLAVFQAGLFSLIYFHFIDN